MEQPVTIRFRWTVNDLLRAHRYHFRHSCRLVFRFGLHLIFALVILGGYGLYQSGKSFAGIAFAFGGVYWFTLRPFERRWMLRRQLNKNPARDIEFEWQVDSDKIFARSSLAQAEFSWQAFSKMVSTPAGVLLYPNDQIYHWLPRHGFASDPEFKRFVELAKSKIHRQYHTK
jgi:hypothetical protein